MKMTIQVVIADDDTTPQAVAQRVISLERNVEDLGSATLGLDYAHTQHIIHRDIKPDNLLLDAKHEIVVSDFGIAVVQHTLVSLSTQDQAGTPLYMAPEQIGQHPCAASDQYAVGVMVYEWLCGAPPFPGPGLAIFAQHLYQEPPSLRERVPDLPQAVEDAVFRALAKDPQQRFASVGDFALVLEEAFFAAQAWQRVRPPIVLTQVPDLPPHQPAVAHTSGMKRTSREAEAIQPEQRQTKRTGMRIHTQDQPDFSRQDYDAPTSSLDPAMLTRKQANLKNEAALTSQPMAKPLSAITAKRPTRSMLTLLPLSIILLLLVVGGANVYQLPGRDLGQRLPHPASPLDEPNVYHNGQA